MGWAAMALRRHEEGYRSSVSRDGTEARALVVLWSRMIAEGNVN